MTTKLLERSAERARVEQRRAQGAGYDERVSNLEVWAHISGAARRMRRTMRRSRRRWDACHDGDADPTHSCGAADGALDEAHCGFGSEASAEAEPNHGTRSSGAGPSRKLIWRSQQIARLRESARHAGGSTHHSRTAVLASPTAAAAVAAAAASCGWMPPAGPL